MEALTCGEKNEILSWSKWGVYRQSEGEIVTLNPLNKKVEAVRSFDLKTIPEFDALLVFGGYPRIVFHAGNILHEYEKTYGVVPEFMTVGRKPNKGQEAEIYEQMMIALGFDRNWVLQNHIASVSDNTKGNAKEICYIVEHSRVMKSKARPVIGVVTEPGYALRVAQELPFLLPQYEFVFYETPVTSIGDRTFCVECFEGYFVDVTLASVLNSMRSWGKERLALPESKMKTAPSFEKIRRYVEKGYTFYMYLEMMHDLGMNDDEQIRTLCEARKIEVVGYNFSGIKVGTGMVEGQLQAVKIHIYEMIGWILKTWKK